MKFLQLPFVSLCVAGGLLPAFSAAQGVRNNDVNCAGVKSCRPRCLTFRVERSLEDCDSSRGIFTVTSRPNPWNLKDFGIAMCENELPGNLTIRIGEEGHTGPIFRTNVYLSENEDEFTFCSIYPCTKGECALPEQMGSILQFDFLGGFVDMQDSSEVALVSINMSLTPAFAGLPLQDNIENRFGALHVNWMDDPTGCREGKFPTYAPVMPQQDLAVSPNTTVIPQTLYCTGPSYEPSPLPQTAPPTSMPTAVPTASPVPTVKPTYSTIELSQVNALEWLYNATEMWSDKSLELHNWFVDPDYCNYTGVGCNSRGWVTSIDLSSRRLSGSIPSSIDGLSRLRSLKLVNNDIGGSIPSQLAELTQLSLIELSSNAITGQVPTEFSLLDELRRVMLQYNKLSGVIPEKLCDIQHLIAFDISGNTDMYGTIPSCFGNLPLEILRVDDVGLVGEVPSGLCDVRPINNLYPNLYGCRAIACPAGTYEMTIGRENGLNEGCIECPTESNVIGSTSCIVVYNNTIATLSPTASTKPSSSPTASNSPSTSSASAWPSSSPSEPGSAAPTQTEGTSSPSQQPSMHPSVDRSSAPSASDQTTEQLSMSPSGAPSIGVLIDSPTTGPSFVRLEVMFSHVSRAMNNTADIELFENVTKTFLAEVLEDDWVVEGVDVNSQSLRVPSVGTEVVAVLDRRRLEGDKEEALFVRMKIDAERRENGAGTSSLEDTVTSALEQDAYVSVLEDELEIFGQNPKLPEPGEVVQPVQPDTENGRRVNWALLGASVTLSVLAIGTVLLVRRMRQRDRRRKEQDHYIGGGGSGEMSPVSYQPEVQSAMEPPSYHHEPEYAMSEESSGGWNSEDSDDFVNQEPSVAVWSTELSLVSKAPDETLV